MSAVYVSKERETSYNLVLWEPDSGIRNVGRRAVQLVTGHWVGNYIRYMNCDDGYKWME